MKYANYDNNGNILGFYSDDIHKVIPEPNIQLTEYEWNCALDGSKMVDTANQILIEKPPYVPTEDELKKQNNQNILSQISALEAKVNRSLRDAILRGDNTFLGQYDNQIAELRSQLIKG